MKRRKNHRMQYPKRWEIGTAIEVARARHDAQGSPLPVRTQPQPQADSLQDSIPQLLATVLLGLTMAHGASADRTTYQDALYQCRMVSGQCRSRCNQLHSQVDGALAAWKECREKCDAKHEQCKASARELYPEEAEELEP
jgi:hypothetical protein